MPCCFPLTIIGARRSSSPARPISDPELVDPRTDEVDTFPIFRRLIYTLSLPTLSFPSLPHPPSPPAAGALLKSRLHRRQPHLRLRVRRLPAWSSYLLPGGILAIHDIFDHAGSGGQAPHSVYRLALASGLLTELPMTRTLGVLQRTGVTAIPPAAQRFGMI